jgi:hypothetical protein
MIRTYAVGTEEELEEGGGRMFLSFQEAREYANTHSLRVAEYSWTFEEREILSEEEEESSEDDSWQRERAMQAGMMGGVQAYNEVMGCDEQEFSCTSCGDRGCDRCYEEVE